MCPCVNGVTSTRVWPVKRRVLLVVWNLKIIFIVFVRGDSVISTTLPKDVGLRSLFVFCLCPGHVAAAIM